MTPKPHARAREAAPEGSISDTQRAELAALREGTER